MQVKSDIGGLESVVNTSQFCIKGFLFLIIFR